MHGFPYSRVGGLKMTYTFSMYLVDKYMRGGDANMNATPESLRARADAADVAGDTATAEALRNEADDLEQNPPAEGDAAPQ